MASVVSLETRLLSYLGASSAPRPHWLPAAAATAAGSQTDSPPSRMRPATARPASVGDSHLRLRPLAFLPEMPIYEYRCPRGHIFEVFQRMDDPQPEGCEVCGKSPLERVLHPAAIHYKGSGFYATDYGRGSRRQAKEASGSDSGGESGKSGKSENKPDSGKSSSSDS